MWTFRIEIWLLKIERIQTHNMRLCLVATYCATKHNQRIAIKGNNPDLCLDDSYFHPFLISVYWISLNTECIYAAWITMWGISLIEICALHRRDLSILAINIIILTIIITPSSDLCLGDSSFLMGAFSTAALNCLGARMHKGADSLRMVFRIGHFSTMTNSNRAVAKDEDQWPTVGNYLHVISFPPFDSIYTF